MSSFHIQDPKKMSEAIFFFDSFLNRSTLFIETFPAFQRSLFFSCQWNPLGPQQICGLASRLLSDCYDHRAPGAALSIPQDRCAARRAPARSRDWTRRSFSFWGHFLGGVSKPLSMRSQTCSRAYSLRSSQASSHEIK
jgi:hypothetical protein